MKKIAALLFSVVLCLALGTTAAAEAEAPLSRAELAQQIADAAALTGDLHTAPHFSDVPEDHPCREGILLCCLHGIMKGKSATVFDPDAGITRAQTAVVLSRAIEALGLPAAEGSEPHFSDVPEDAWFSPGVIRCCQYGLMAGRDGAFRPTAPAEASSLNLQPLRDFSALPLLDLSEGSLRFRAASDSGIEVIRNGAVICSGSGFRIRQSGSSTGNTVTVESGAPILSIQNLCIAPAADSAEAPISVLPGASLTLCFESDNTLSAPKRSDGQGVAGIFVPPQAALTLQGGGTLKVFGGENGAGIGGAYHRPLKTGGDAGTITIRSGSIEARGGSYSAGIGGGNTGCGGSITISGGTVTAWGKTYAAAIGGGDNGGCGGRITISGGTVAAYGKAAAIGGGDSGDGGTISIRNAKVTAEGHFCAIGGGRYDILKGCDALTIDRETTELQLSHSDYGGKYDCQEKILDAHLDTSIVAALDGRIPLLKTNAHGHSGLTYQWESRSGSEDWTPVEGQTGAALTVPLSDDTNGRFYRCIVTNGWGNVYESIDVKLVRLAFLEQPKDLQGGFGTEGRLTVKVPSRSSSSCAAAFQWQHSPDGIHWTDLSGDGVSVSGGLCSLAVRLALDTHNTFYRCRVTASNGDAIYSEPARVLLKLEQPGYTVRYFTQQADGTYTAEQQLVDAETADVGTTVTAPQKALSHYTENLSLSRPSGLLAEDGSLLLTRYYDRDSFTIRFDCGDAPAPEALKLRFGAKVQLPTPERNGFRFSGWFRDPACTAPAALAVMPTEDLTLYAGWTREPSYRIEGIDLLDSEGHALSGPIPKDAFSVVVRITPLFPQENAIVVLAFYTAEDQFLSLACKPVEASTVFTADNTDGALLRLKAFLLSSLDQPLPLSSAAAYPQ